MRGERERGGGGKGRWSGRAGCIWKVFKIYVQIQGFINVFIYVFILKYNTSKYQNTN